MEESLHMAREQGVRLKEGLKRSMTGEAERVEHASQELERLQRELQDASTKNTAQEDELNELYRQVATLTDTLKEMEEASQRVAQLPAGSMGGLECREAALEAREASVDERSQELERAEEACRAATQELSSEMARLRKIRHENEEEAKRVNEAKEDRLRALAECEDLIQQQQADIEGLNAEIERMREEAKAKQLREPSSRPALSESVSPNSKGARLAKETETDLLFAQVAARRKSNAITRDSPDHENQAPESLLTPASSVTSQGSMRASNLLWTGTPPLETPSRSYRASKGSRISGAIMSEKRASRLGRLQASPANWSERPLFSSLGDQ